MRCCILQKWRSLSFKFLIFNYEYVCMCACERKKREEGKREDEVLS